MYVICIQLGSLLPCHISQSLSNFEVFSDHVMTVVDTTYVYVPILSHNWRLRLISIGVGHFISDSSDHIAITMVWIMIKCHDIYSEFICKNLNLSMCIRNARFWYDLFSFHFQSFFFFPLIVWLNNHYLVLVIDHTDLLF